jgi:hypothetical protein
MCFAAQAQKPTVSYSATECYKYSGKEYAKVWQQADPGNLKSRSEYIDPKTGEMHITIFRQDSGLVMYSLEPKTKTGLIMPLGEMSNLGVSLGLVKENSSVQKTELVGKETINGYECHHYMTTMKSTLITGAEESGCLHYWMYEPLNVQMQSANCGFDEPLVLNNFKQGSQPAHLFVIPKDYTLQGLPIKEFKDDMKKFQDALKMLEQGMKK